jgi:hypothetical protein
MMTILKGEHTGTKTRRHPPFDPSTLHKVSYPVPGIHPHPENNYEFVNIHALVIVKVGKAGCRYKVPYKEEYGERTHR